MLKILFVDDEPKVLEGLRRSLRTLRKEWTPDFANGAVEGLQMLESNNFDVVVTDLRMPGMDGFEFLRRATVQHPDVLRIVLSGGYEREDAVRSSDVSHEYLQKPCSLDELRLAIVRAASLRPC